MKFMRRPAEERRQIAEAVLLLRFQTTRPSSSTLHYRTYAGIAGALRVPYGTVQHICRRATAPAPATKKAP